MNKKTIGIIIYANPEHYPPTINAIHLLSQDFDIILIGRNQDPPFWQYPANVKVHRLGKYTSVKEREKYSVMMKFWDYVNFIKEARHLLKNVSLIYAYDAFAYISVCIYQILHQKKQPLIYHNHDLSGQIYSLSSLSGWIQRFERKWLHKANFVVLPSQERASFLKKITNFNGQIIVVPNFPRKLYFLKHQDFDKLITYRFQKLQILLQGSISPKNSLLELINSLTFLDEGIELKLIGPIQEQEKELMISFAFNKNVSKRVQYFMPVPYNELLSHTWKATVGVCLYKKTDINHQTMGTASNKIYEYAACGLPVIVSDQPNYREHLANENWVRFADPDNHESIALAVKDILHDFSKYKTMCLDARLAFEEKYNYESAFLPLISKIQGLVNYN